MTTTELLQRLQMWTHATEFIRMSDDTEVKSINQVRAPPDTCFLSLSLSLSLSRAGVLLED